MQPACQWLVKKNSFGNFKQFATEAHFRSAARLSTPGDLRGKFHSSWGKAHGIAIGMTATLAYTRGGTWTTLRTTTLLRPETGAVRGQEHAPGLAEPLETTSKHRAVGKFPRTT
jgi:hypothetical protein